MDFLNRLKGLRTHFGVSQTKMAVLGGVSQQLYNRYERGEVVPTMPFFVALQENTGVSLNWLIGGVGEMFTERDEDREKERALLRELRRLLGVEGGEKGS